MSLFVDESEVEDSIEIKDEIEVSETEEIAHEVVENPTHTIKRRKLNSIGDQADSDDDGYYDGSGDDSNDEEFDANDLDYGLNRDGLNLDAINYDGLKLNAINYDGLDVDALESSSDSDEFEDINYLTVPVNKPKTNARKNHRHSKYKLSLHYLSMVTYPCFLYNRNQQLNKVTKKLYKLIPKKIRKLIKTLSSDQSLIYILKYLLKWFRLNFKINDIGLRVLGYFPHPGVFTDYFPTSTDFNLSSIIKSFSSNRDVAAQIFNTLLKSCGWKARLVFSIPLLSTKSSDKQPKLNHEKLKVNRDLDLLYPYFWTELINPLNDQEIIVLESSCFHQENDRLIRLNRCGDPQDLSTFYTDKFYPSHPLNLMSMHWVLSIDEFSIIDVSSRYIPNIAYRYFDKLDLRTELGRTALLMQSILKCFNKSIHNDSELMTLKQIALKNYQIPSTYSAMKKNPNVITPLTLRYNEVIDGNPLGSITLDGKKQLLYFKNDIIVGKSERQWKYLGRSINPNELDHPIKTFTNLNATTIYNKRIIEFNQINQPELNNIALFSYKQTIPYIKMKPLVENGIKRLPRNKWGNIEIFHDCMIPDDCQWIQFSNIISIVKLYKQKKLKFFYGEFDYVPVLVGFNFSVKARQAIPIIKGILVFKQDLNLVKKVWFEGKLELLKTQYEHKRIRNLIGWKTLLQFLRIKNNLDSKYGPV